MSEALWRPQIHYSSPKNWINDPNGLVYADGRYHLFYQYNPFGDLWGHMSWGHAVSTDLVHWSTLPGTAILEEDSIMIFSGSAVHDKDNTSKLSKEGIGPLVAIYSGHQSNPQLQTQNLAYSLDNGQTWTKYVNNPVLDINRSNFRDPKVFWHESDRCWVMAVSLADVCQIAFYSSSDLKNWTKTGIFGPEGVEGYPEWECPELFQINTEDTSESKGILTIDLGDAGKTGSASQYFIGNFDGKTFINENDQDLILWTDFGKDFYAAQRFNSMPDDRNVWIGWMNNWRYAREIPTSPWRGAMSLPRTCTLSQTSKGYRLRQKPIDEIYQLRNSPSIELTTLSVSSEHTLDIRLNVFELQTEIKPNGTRQCGIRVRVGSDEVTEIGFDRQSNHVYLDRSRSGTCDFHQDFANKVFAPRCIKEQGSISFQIIVDLSSVEVFADNGLAVISELIFPALESSGITLFADGGEAEFTNLAIYPLEPIRNVQGTWHQLYEKGSDV